MSGIKINDLTIGNPDGWVLKKCSNGGVLYHISNTNETINITGTDYARVDEWISGKEKIIIYKESDDFIDPYCFSG